MMTACPICGGIERRGHRVLWAELIAEWELAPHEVDYIDRQQGEICTSCNASLRIMALGGAIATVWNESRPLRHIVEDRQHTDLLDVNGAETISTVLSNLPGYVRVDYPEVDLQGLPYEANSFDMIVHSDTLEHVPNAVRALEECRRVLRPGGALCFTIPMIVGRMSRSRATLPPSYHGSSATGSDDFVVQTEFGADAWTYLARAGFTQIGVHVFSYPAAQAFVAYKSKTGDVI